MCLGVLCVLLETNERPECGLAAHLAESLGLSVTVQKLLRLCRPRGGASNFGAYAGKPEAFRKESGQAAKTSQVSSRYLLVIRQAGVRCVGML